MDGEKYHPTQEEWERAHGHMTEEQLQQSLEREDNQRDSDAEIHARGVERELDRVMRPKVFADIRERLAKESQVRYDLSDDLEKRPGDIYGPRGGRVILWETTDAQEDINHWTYDERLSLLHEAVRTLPTGYELAFSFGGDYTILGVPDSITDEQEARRVLQEAGFPLPRTADFQESQGGNWYFDWNMGDDEQDENRIVDSRPKT